MGPVSRPAIDLMAWVLVSQALRERWRVARTFPLIIHFRLPAEFVPPWPNEEQPTGVGRCMVLRKTDSGEKRGVLDTTDR